MDAEDSPFEDDLDRTIIKPMPGGRRPRPSTEHELTAFRRSSSEGQAAVPLPRNFINSFNHLADTAGILLSLAGQLRETISLPDIDELRGHVEGEIKLFEGVIREEGAKAEVVTTASYLLCTLLDEIVLGTPWGNESKWGEQTLLTKIHREARGGEKFFSILDHLLEEPARHIDLLELAYLCLVMGFEGKYRVQAEGRRKLQSVEENLFYTIREIRGEFERELSPNWAGVRDRRNLLVRYVPLWVLGAVLSALLVAIFIGFRVGLVSNSDPVFTQLNAIGRSIEVDSTATVDLPVPRMIESSSPRLTQLLAPEITEGKLFVSELSGKSLVIIQGDGLFHSGSASIDERRYRLLVRIGEALRQVPGRVLVVGHTDNVPIRSLRFSSNWDLSRQRAVSVAQLLAETTGDRKRYITEGRADAEPIVANDSATNRSRNRRVEIVVLQEVGDL